MLSELYIENLAVIKKARINFNQGLNIFTGETGAGKSIVIDAINAILGQRTSRVIIRHGADKATITACFQDISDKVIAKLTEYGFETEDNQLIIEREISLDKSNARIMGRPVAISVLKEIGYELINIHGQHDSQILLAPERHIEILDNFGGYSKLMNEYYNCYKSVVLIKRELKKLSQSEQKKEENVLILTQQVEEIFNANLIKDEDILIKTRLNEEKNRAKILTALQISYDCINNSDENNCITDISNNIVSSLANISDFYDSANEISNKIEGLAAEFSEIATDISNLISEFSLAENSLQAIEAMQERLDLINKLRRKYGDSVEEIIEFGNKAQVELDELTFSDKKIKDLSEKGNAEFKRLIVIAQELTKQREIAGEKFSKAIRAELEFLDMPNVNFITEITQIKPNINGQDGVQFLISTNLGEPPKPIAKIASGGELSRIMLAIKNIMVDKIQTLIFDEIDTGVSGHAAQKIGLKLSQVAKNIQVIAVTHSAQIAALADHHFLIAKNNDNESTFTSVTELDKTGRINEVARIMSTDKITDLMVENAKQMIEHQ